MTPQHPFADLALFANNPPWVETAVAAGLLLAIATIANLVVKLLIVRLIVRLKPIDSSNVGVIAGRLANIVPAMIIAGGIAAVPHLPDAAVAVIRNVSGAFVILTLARSIGRTLDLLNELYTARADAINRPIKGYLQVLKIVIYCGATILVVAVLFERSPLLLLSGLGAMAAVLMLVFKDTILSLVASVQLTSNDMLRVGDWIEMPQLNADGDVIDIALHTVKVQNFDKTITSIPTHRLIAESYKNWRGMSEAGARRIKRSLLIDQTSIRFLSDEEREGLGRFRLLRAYLDEKDREIGSWNAALGEDDAINNRRPTNLGTFRAYVVNYLRDHGRITPEMTLLVRQLAPSSLGLPLEIYCFADTTAWGEYESIQSDIFDHLLAILPEFGLRVFQEPNGSDIALAERLDEALIAAS